MPLVRWEPMTELEQMRRRMERTFDRLMPLITWAPQVPEWAAQIFEPDVDVYRAGDEIVVQASLPGMKAEDISVESTANSISIAGECRCGAEYKEADFYRAERQYGTFCQTIPLPDKIQEQQVKATFKDGVLTVRAPVSEEAKRERQKVPVQTTT